MSRKPGMDPGVWPVLGVILCCYVAAFWLLFKM
jgi:hypothetical protein